MIQIDMEMPEMCLMCPFYQDAWSYCKLGVNDIHQALERPKDCPFKEPAPTITLDELKEIREKIRFETDRRTAMLCEEDVLAILDKKISELESR